MTEITQQLTVAQSGVAGPAGPRGPRGATFRFGSGVPAPGLGNNDDQYLDYDSADLYGKSDGNWAKLRNIRGPQGAKGDKGDQGIQGIQGIQGEQGLGILAGNGAPANSLGRNDEHYVELDSPNKKLHKKTGGAWAVIGNLAGPKGDTGRGIAGLAVLADGTLRASYTDGTSEDAGPFPVEGLGRLVCTTSQAGSLTTPNYWVKIATIKLTGDWASAGLMLALSGTAGSSAAALVSVHVRQDRGPGTLEGGSGVHIAHLAGIFWGNDSFKLVSDGYDQPVELWIKKLPDFALTVSVFELCKSVRGAEITYHDGGVWQAAEPSAAYVKQSAGLTYGEDKKIYHEGHKPTPAEIGAVKAGGTVSIGKNGSGSATFDADGNLSLNLTVSYAASAGSASSAGSADNADKVDNLHAWQFIRSDTDDTVSGHTEWQDGKETRWGNDADMRMMHNNSHGYLSLYKGDFYIRDGTTTRYLFDVSNGNLHADGHVFWLSSSTGSDPLLKTNVRLIDKPIARLKKLNGVFFDWKDSGRGSGGCMSPDLRRALPRTVYKSKLKKDGKRYDQAEYNAVTGLLVEVCKDQEGRLEQQSQALKEQAKTLIKLQRMVETLQRHNKTGG
ncbi:hypothetical protein [Microbulbifer sp. PSTR4-B]|uniref:hypothetical protein n=1 Tax=unclassified Microbulbifer TaxID=2619833 RepID=UPI00403AE4C6